MLVDSPLHGSGVSRQLELLGGCLNALRVADGTRFPTIVKLAKGDTPTYSELADEAERIGESVSAPWSTASHLKAVKDTPALRKADDAAIAKVESIPARDC